MKPLNILISGAGIAGLGLAHWLARTNHRVVVLDKEKVFSPRGHVLSLKGTGVQVLNRLGLVEELRASSFGLTHTRYQSKSGRVLRRTQAAEVDQTLGGYIMVRRADLHRVLFNHLPPSVDTRFDVEIRSIRQIYAGAAVDLSDGTTLEFDLVVGADGVHSPTRTLALADVETEYLHGHYIAFVLDYTHGWDPTETRAVFGGGRNVNLLPRGKSALAMVVYQDDLCAPIPASGPSADWRDYFLAHYRDFPSFVRKAFAAIQNNDDLYFDQIMMVPVQKLVNRRVVLVGDAGYCPTFFSGMGAAAALQGGFCLAAQLNQPGDDLAGVLRSYERRILPVVQNYQRSAKTMRSLLLARSWKTQAVRNLGFQFMSDQQLRARAQAFYHTEVSMNALEKPVGAD